MKDNLLTILKVAGTVVFALAIIVVIARGANESSKEKENKKIECIDCLFDDDAYIADLEIVNCCTDQTYCCESKVFVANDKILFVWEIDGVEGIVDLDLFKYPMHRLNKDGFVELSLEQNNCIKFRFKLLKKFYDALEQGK